MYINVEGNAFGTCLITARPEYSEESGVHKAEVTRVTAKFKEASANGPITGNLTLAFYGPMAIPAMKIESGMRIVFAGRESSKELMKNGKNALFRLVYVEWWTPQEIDPVGMLTELKVRREMTVRHREFKETFWDFMMQCKALILSWFEEWYKNKKAGAAAAPALPVKKEESGNVKIKTE